MGRELVPGAPHRAAAGRVVTDGAPVTVNVGTITGGSALNCRLNMVMS